MCRNLLYILLLSFFSLSFFISCDKNHRSQAQAQGGQDVGGGETLRSSEEEVRIAVDNVITLSRNTTGYYRSQNPLHTALINLKGTDLDQVVQKIFFPEGWIKAETDSKEIEVFYEGSLFLRDRKKSFDNFFVTSQIEWIYKGSCPSPDGKHADASVNAHKMGAKLCLSMENLTRIPPESLFREILLLMIHEFSHMAGYREEIAQKLQDRMRQELSMYESYINQNYAAVKIRNNLTSSIQLAEKLKKLYDETPQDPKVGFLASEIINKLSWEMPGFLYPLLLKAGLGSDKFQMYNLLERLKVAWLILYTYFSGNGYSEGNPKNELFDYRPQFMDGYFNTLDNPQDFSSNIEKRKKAIIIVLKILDENLKKLDLNSYQITEMQNPDQIKVTETNQRNTQGYERVKAVVNSIYATIKDFHYTDPFMTNPLYRIAFKFLGTELDSAAMKIFYPSGWPLDFTFTKTGSGPTQEMIEKWELNHEVALSTYLVKSKLILLENGLCPGMTTEQELGSVYDHQIGSTICLNAKALERLSQGQLYIETFSFLIGAAAKLNNLKDSETIQIQEKFKAELFKLSNVLQLDPKEIRENLYYKFKEVEKSLNEIKMLQKQEPMEMNKIYKKTVEVLNGLAAKDQPYYSSSWLLMGVLADHFPKMKYALLLSQKAARYVNDFFNELSKSRLSEEKYFENFQKFSDDIRYYYHFMRIEEFKISQKGGDFYRITYDNYEQALEGAIKNTREAIEELERHYPELKKSLN